MKDAVKLGQSVGVQVVRKEDRQDRQIEPAHLVSADFMSEVIVDVGYDQEIGRRLPNESFDEIGT